MFPMQQFERLFQFSRRIEDLMYTITPEEVSCTKQVTHKSHCCSNCNYFSSYLSSSSSSSCRLPTFLSLLLVSSTNLIISSQSKISIFLIIVSLDDDSNLPSHLCLLAILHPNSPLILQFPRPCQILTGDILIFIPIFKQILLAKG